MNKFRPPKNAQRQFNIALRKFVAKAANVARPHVREDGVDFAELSRAMTGYSEASEPWAKAVSATFLKRINAQNLKDWKSIGAAIHKRLKQDIATTVIGQVLKQLQDEQVTLIKSIPLQMAEQVQQRAREAIAAGERPDAVIPHVQGVADSRARLIARTEAAKAASMLTQSRAEHVGATQYIWRAMMDGQTRESHAEMDGRVCQLAEPPVLPDGDSYHPGQFPNCRCYMDIILPKAA